jgi:hypothetical protein
VPWSGESKQTYDKNMVCQYLKLGIKCIKNAVLFVMIELSRGCAHLISPYGVLYGCVAVFRSMLFSHPVVSMWMSSCGVPVRIATYLL